MFVLISYIIDVKECKVMLIMPDDGVNSVRRCLHCRLKIKGWEGNMLHGVV